MDATTSRMDRTGGRPTWKPLACTPLLAIALLISVLGCRSDRGFHFSGQTVAPTSVATQIENPDTQAETCPETANAAPPQTALTTGDVQYWPLKLEEAMQIALSHSRVMRDVGGRILRSPNLTSTAVDAAISETDPLRGPEAALSAFDAQFSTALFWTHTDLDVNIDGGLLGGLGGTLFTGLGGSSQLDIGVAQAQLSKVAATGTQFYVRDQTLYGKNTFLLDFDGYTSRLSAGFRQPLLQGAGIQFNRIAGPNARPGMYNGVLIARINTDVTLADFEASVRDMLFDVEQTYWQLYRAYRDLDARITGREAALHTWQLVQRRLESGATDREQEAHAREQYYAFDAQVINSQTGLTAAGQGAGNSPGAPGVLTLERRLRWLMGLPPSDGRLIRPSDSPTDVRVVFDWSESLQDALTRRVELRRQRWVIKRRELELIASRNFLRMRLDATGEYGVGSLGMDLNGDTPLTSGDLFSGHEQDWKLGVQLATPIGNRIGHTAVRNAELELTRERALYREQELRAVHDLSDSVANVDRSYAIARASFNGFIAAHQQLEEVRKKYDAGLVPLDFLLDAQRRAVEADSAYYQATVEYSISITNVYYNRGTLLEYDNVYLNEGPWSEEAYASAMKQSRRFGPRILNYVYEAPPAISIGPVAQGVVCPKKEVPGEPAATAEPASQNGTASDVAEPPAPAQDPANRVSQLDPPVVDLGVESPAPLRQPAIGQIEMPVQRTALEQPSRATIAAIEPVAVQPVAEPVETRVQNTPDRNLVPGLVSVDDSDIKQPAIGQFEVPIQPMPAKPPAMVAAARPSGLKQPSIGQVEMPIQRTSPEMPTSEPARSEDSGLRQPAFNRIDLPITR